MNQDNTSHDDANFSEPSTTPSKFDRATFIKSRLKSGAKRLLSRKDSVSSANSDNVSDLFDDAAFDPQQVIGATSQDGGSLREKLHRGAHGIVATVKNPRRAMRSRYVRTIVGNVTGPHEAYESRYDGELVDAHDALDRADVHAGTQNDKKSRWDLRDSESSIENESERNFFDAPIDSTDSVVQDVQDARDRVHQVEAQRDSLRIAWILGRHVRRVRVAKPMPYQPTKSDFIQGSSDQKQQRIQWGKYLASTALWYTRGFTPYHIDDFDEPPFNLKDLSLIIERLAVVSGPWQSFLIEIRNVYLWHDRMRTFKFLAIYSLLWYYSHIMTALFAWIVVATVKNKLYPTQLETIKKRARRAEDDQAKAQAWGELIQQHGKHDWVEPLLDDCGPLIQLELSDLSNLLEILQNFYRWERPSKTAATLFFFVTCLLTSLFADSEFCIRLLWLGMGAIFFFSLPLAARYPKYRKLVIPLYWIFWDVPNVAELAIEQLQEKAVLRDAARLEEIRIDSTLHQAQHFLKSDSTFSLDSGINVSQKDDMDVLQTICINDQVTFRAVHSVTRADGHLKLLRSGFWYRDKKLKSYYSYSQLSEMRKVEVTKANNPDASMKARLARRIEETTSFRILPAGIEFIFTSVVTGPCDNEPSEVYTDRTRPDEQKLALTVSEPDRDRIFSLVISWSNLKWQPLYSLNTRDRLSTGADHPSKHGKGNKDLDTAIKSFVE